MRKKNGSDRKFWKLSVTIVDNNLWKEEKVSLVILGALQISVLAVLTCDLAVFPAQSPLIQIGILSCSEPTHSDWHTSLL